MPNDSPAEALQDYKLAALGNFFDNDVGLPGFFSGYLKPGQAEFEDGIQITRQELINVSGKNTLVKHDDGNHRWSLFFDSESHVVMRWDDASSSYHYHQFYRNAAGNKARQVDVAVDQTYKGVRELAVEDNVGKITQVFSTQFSGCNLQVAFVGTNQNQPEYIIFSHLQNKSRLASLLAHLRCLETNILAVFNITWPDVGAVTNCYHDIDQVPEINRRSITFVRDTYVWPVATVQSGFGMALCGFQLAADASIRLAAIGGYSNLFGTATMLNLGLLPIFNCTPDPIQQMIEQIRPLLTFYWVWKSKAQKATELAEIKNYYFELFEQGKFGDGSFVANFIPRDKGAREEFIKQFILLYNSGDSGKNLRKLLELAQFEPCETYIRWKNAVPIGTIIQQIQAAALPDLSSLLVDLGVASIQKQENLRRTFGKLL